MTDLQEHVEAPGRAELVKQVSEKIKETGVDYIYYQFISVTGRIVGKGIPAAHWERLAEKGFQLVYGSTANLFVDRHGDYIGYVDKEDNIKYFTVSDDGRINSDNAHTRLGYKGYYRSIICVNADVDEFDPNY